LISSPPALAKEEGGGKKRGACQEKKREACPAGVSFLTLNRGKKEGKGEESIEGEKGKACRLFSALLPIGRRGGGEKGKQFKEKKRGNQDCPVKWYRRRRYAIVERGGGKEKEKGSWEREGSVLAIHISWAIEGKREKRGGGGFGEKGKRVPNLTIFLLIRGKGRNMALIKKKRASHSTFHFESL